MNLLLQGNLPPHLHLAQPDSPQARRGLRLNRQGEQAQEDHHQEAPTPRKEGHLSPREGLLGKQGNTPPREENQPRP